MSYNYTDFIQNNGIQILYPATTFQDSTRDYILTTSAFYSDLVSIQGTMAANQTVAAKEEDLDFDITFVIPRDIDGVCTISVPLAQTKVAGSSAHMYFIFKVRKWDGSTETDLVTGQSRNIDWDTSDKSEIASSSLTIPRTHFQEGETLRLTIELWGVNNDGGNALTYDIGIDPKNRNTSDFDSGDPTISEFHVPFVIDS